jgi:hypothetical protein
MIYTHQQEINPFEQSFSTHHVNELSQESMKQGPVIPYSKINSGTSSAPFAQLL